MPTKLQEKRYKDSKNIYCGNSKKLPKKYHMFGSRYDCLRRGVGVGLYVVPKTKNKERLKEIKKKRKDEDELNVDDIKYEHEHFLDKNFKKAYKNTKNVDAGQILKQLAILRKAKNS
jgi:hypothetical protein